jgi:signal transduction histidine kinase
MVNGMATDPHFPRSSARRELRGPFFRWPRAADAALAIGVFLTIVFVSIEGPNDELVFHSLGDASIAALVLYAVASGVLYWRRHRPLVVLGITLVLSALPTTLLPTSDMVGFAMLVALYSVGHYATNDRWSYIGLGGALALVALTPLIMEGVTTPEIGFGFVFMFAVWYVGRRVRGRGERAAQLEREQAAEAGRVVAEERTRIARELHDVVAHRVSMMTVQAGAAKTVALDDPEGASQAMEAVEKAGRQVLGELRHLLGVLRPEAELDGLGPQPGLAEVPRLVEQLEEAGLNVSLTMDVAQIDLPTSVDLSAYRIVQEALTNVLKHAGPNARTEVRLSTDNNEVTIEVLDSGHGVTILPGSGHGILGMRERALLLGGSLQAGPRAGGGFQVVAHLPISAEPA